MIADTADIESLEEEFRTLIEKLREGIQALDQLKALRALRDDLEKERERARRELNKFEGRTQEIENLEQRAKNLESALNTSKADIEAIIQDIPDRHKAVVEETLFQPFAQEMRQAIDGLNEAINGYQKRLGTLETEVSLRLEAMESRSTAQIDTIQKEIAILRQESAEVLEQRIDETRKQIISQQNQKLKWYLAGIVIVAIVGFTGLTMSAVLFIMLGM